MIQVEQVAVKLGGRWVLDSLSFTVAPGETVVVTGANGVGKSVLARTVAGLGPTAGGAIRINGLPIQRRKAKRGVGYLPQTGGIYDYLTVIENLRFFAAMAGVGWRKRRKVCLDLIELVGLTDTAAVDGARLTPGQRQRLLIARALVGDPMALLFDDPQAGLDREGRTELRQLLGELSRQGKAILIVTGEPDGVPHDRLLHLRAGRVEEGGMDHGRTD
jgi:ABC-2 type transport system ATP-binding protein